MQPILISFSIILVGVIAAVLLFSVAMRSRGEGEETQPPGATPTSPGKFFLDEGGGPDAGSSIPADALPLQVERHVRLEHEAAEGFVRTPNADTLQTPSASDLKEKRP